MELRRLRFRSVADPTTTPDPHFQIPIETSELTAADDQVSKSRASPSSSVNVLNEEHPIGRREVRHIKNDRHVSRQHCTRRRRVSQRPESCPVSPVRYRLSQLSGYDSVAQFKADKAFALAVAFTHTRPPEVSATSSDSSLNCRIGRVF